MKTKELEVWVERTCDAIKCECGGYCERVDCTEEECKKYGCGRDEPGNECCSIAFVCCVCGQRYAGCREAPEMEDF